jgi:hypothetical protein
MANENIDPNSIQHPDHPEHHTWLQSLAEKIHNLDTEFPLSGGETDEDLERATHVDEEPINEDKNEPPAGEDPHKQHHLFEQDVKHLDTDFPLSGGEEK